MKLHKRYFVCQKADAELSLAMLDIFHKHDLTEAEAAEIAATVLGRFITRRFQLLLRIERHGDITKPSGEA